MSNDSLDEVLWHPETIPPDTEELVGSLARVLPSGAYLAGGTGLALRLGHRRSVDLDFFLPSVFDEELLLQGLRVLRGIVVEQRAPQTLHLAIEGVKVSFMSYTYPLLFPVSLFRNVPVADPRDVSCMKITAIAGRGSKRDFIDVFVASERFGLAELLNLADRKFAQTRYNKLHILKSLTYFADAEKDPLPHMLVPVDWVTVKSFFEQEASRIR
jgi:hypothetical protein